ncbi:MAG: hypothetical protein JWM21_1821 [Acidobacteria bacterium]|nr:hypothetical protein [Acidobacteriota bacterium]
MKMTIITNAKGEITGSVRGQYLDRRTVSGQAASILPSQGQKLYEIEFPDELTDCDPGELHKRLGAHRSKTKKG